MKQLPIFIFSFKNFMSLWATYQPYQKFASAILKHCAMASKRRINDDDENQSQSEQQPCRK